MIGRTGSGRDLLLFLNNDVELISRDCLQVMAMQLRADESCGFVGIRLVYPEDGRVQHGGIQVADEPLYVCGYHRLDHAKGREDFVADERIALGVTFACAMTRSATFDALGGFEEILIPNAYGDVDLCARSVESGLREHATSACSIGTHHESEDQGPRDRGRRVSGPSTNATSYIVQPMDAAEAGPSPRCPSHHQRNPYTSYIQPPRRARGQGGPMSGRSGVLDPGGDRPARAHFSVLRPNNRPGQDFVRHLGG